MKKSTDISADISADFFQQGCVSLFSTTTDGKLIQASWPATVQAASTCRQKVNWTDASGLIHHRVDGTDLIRPAPKLIYFFPSTVNLVNFYLCAINFKFRQKSGCISWHAWEQPIVILHIKILCFTAFVFKLY